MIILGVDPGLRVTGYGAIQKEGSGFALVEAGVIRTDAKGGIARRLGTLYSGIKEVLKDFKPGVLVVEKLFAHYKHPATAILMAHARGVVCLAAHEEGVAMVSVPSTRVKKSVVSLGHASKGQVQRAVQMLLGLEAPPSPPDTADALAVALSYGLTAVKFRERDAALKRIGEARILERARS